MYVTLQELFAQGLRKFTLGNNGVEFTRDAQIKYQAMTFDFNVTHLGTRSKPDFLFGQTPAYSSWLCFGLGTLFCQGCFAPLATSRLTNKSLWSSL